MRVRMWMAAAVLTCCSGIGWAQAGSTAATGAPTGAPMEPAKAEDAMLSLFEHELTGVVNAMPADKFNFAPSASVFAPSQGAKFEGVRTFAQQADHLILANYFFFAAITGTKPPIDPKTINAMTSKSEIVAALGESFAYAHKAVDMITAANAFETIKGVDGMRTRATVASFAVAHGFDHYGQMVEYLRMNGVVPPGSK